MKPYSFLVPLTHNSLLTQTHSCWPLVASACPDPANFRKRTEAVTHDEKQAADISGLFLQRTRVFGEQIYIRLAFVHDI